MGLFYSQKSETQLAKMSVEDLNRHAMTAFRRYKDSDDSSKNLDDIQYSIRVLGHIAGRISHAERIETNAIRQGGGGGGQRQAGGGKPN